MYRGMSVIEIRLIVEWLYRRLEKYSIIWVIYEDPRNRFAQCLVVQAARTDRYKTNPILLLNHFLRP